jgi:glucose/arabinose dehydrogenase
MRAVPRGGRGRCAAALLAVAVIAPFLVLASATPAAATTLPSGFVEVEVAHPLPRPTAMAVAADNRVFIALQGGQLREVKAGALLTNPVITLPVDSNGERGLDGVALDPSFATNGFIYLYYTATTPVAHNRVSRFTVVGDTADPATETVLLDIDPLSTLTQHNGGAVHFGTDGKLYVAVGDNQTSANAQSMSTLKGKVLRINPNGSIPTDNPFYATASGNNRAIWLLGFRNPFTFGVQRTTGRTFINDVGSDFYEEIDDGVAGSNYGWPNTEGYTSDPAFRSPIYAYAHGGDSNTGCAITGGDFYNPTTPQFPSNYFGKYFFLDFCNGWIKMLDPSTNVVSDFASSIHTYPLGLTTGPDGSLYYLANNTDGLGSLWKIAYTGSLAPTIGSQPQSQLVSVGYTATFTVSASGYQPLSYQWYRNGAAITGATSATYTTPATTAADNGARFKVVVTNSFGQATSNDAVLSTTTDKPPTPVIATPSSGTMWNAGDVISYSGGATDFEDGQLPASRLTWRVDFGHHAPGTPNAHFHPFVPNTTGVSSGSFTIPTSGETDPDVFYRIILTATDSAGLTTTTFLDIHPNLSTITLASAPSGLLLTLEGHPVTTPYSVQSVVGLSRTIGTLTPQTLGGVVYAFTKWSDGGALSHNITTPPTNTTYTATFTNARKGSISADPNPINTCSSTGVTNISWSASGVTAIEVHLNSPTGTLFATGGAGTQTRTTGNWVSSGMVFYLQDTSGGAPLTAANTLATTTVNLTSNGCTPNTIWSTPNPIQVCDGSVGASSIGWTTTGPTSVEVRLNSPSGPLFAATGPGPQNRDTGKWVAEGTTFYLQDRTNGAPLTSAHTIATTVVHITTAGCKPSVTGTPNPIQVCDGSGFGVTALTWASFGTTTVQMRVGGPAGPLFSTSGSGVFTKATGKWVGDNTTFYLQDVSGGKALTAANTLATTTISLTSLGCKGSIVADPNPVQVCDTSGTGQTTIRWNSTGVQQVEVHINHPNGNLFASTGPGSFSAATGKWVDNGMTFYLQDVSGGLPLTDANTIAVVQASTTSLGCRGTIVANPNPIMVCDGTGAGQTLISWNTSGPTRVEVHLGSPSGGLFAASNGGAASAATGKWVREGTTFYLQDVSGGLPLTAANTIAVVTAHLTQSGC